MTRRTSKATFAAALLAAAAAAFAGSALAERPDTIDLPGDFAGEGVATGRGGLFYAGSRTDGRIARGNLRDSAAAEVFVDDPLIDAATGIKADVRHGLLWVAGAATGQAAVYDLATGDGVMAFDLASGATFINDVVVTRDAAYFTDSMSPVIYRIPVSGSGELGDPQPIALSGPAAQDHIVGAFNLNGIDATRDGGTLFVVNSTRGSLYTVDPATGASTKLLPDGSVPTADGILLTGRELLVLQNGAQTGENQISTVRLAARNRSAEIVDVYTNDLFETATTLARYGSTFVAVNAQFVMPPPIDDEPEVVLFRLS